jgi:general stress protein YciG
MFERDREPWQFEFDDEIGEKGGEAKPEDQKGETPKYEEYGEKGGEANVGTEGESYSDTILDSGEKGEKDTDVVSGETNRVVDEDSIDETM